jgi:uncharacterized protein involved in exopolysaccharide biosynthesis
MKNSSNYLENLTFMDVINILNKCKISIIKNVFYISFITAIFSFILPKTFTAVAVLMPPGSQQDISILNAFSDSELPFGGLISKTEEEAMRLIAILKSRTVMETIIKKYNLIEFYKAENIEEALKSLADHVSLEIEEEGTLSIKAHVSTGWLHYDKDELKVRELSAEIANEFVNQLDIVNKRLQTEQAVHQRKFLGERYGENLMDLIKAEEKLKQFKENHNIISIESQTRTAIESAAALKNQILIKEVQKGVVSRKLKLNHPEIIGIEDEIRELTVKLHEIEYGRDTSENVRGNLFLVLSEIPQIDADLMRLTREVDIQSTLFIYLTQQYEDAKIQEAKNTPTIQLLDPAVTPIKKSSPKRLLMVFIMALITFVFSSIYALIKVIYAPGDNL